MKLKQPPTETETEPIADFLAGIDTDGEIHSGEDDKKRHAYCAKCYPNARAGFVSLCGKRLRSKRKRGIPLWAFWRTWGREKCKACTFAALLKHIEIAHPLNRKPTA